MNSQILTNINSFLRKRLIESLGTLLVFIAIFLLAIIISYSPDVPNFIYTPENVEINNIGGFYGSVISDFFLQSVGLISILFVFNLLSWGLTLINEKIINNNTIIVADLSYKIPQNYSFIDLPYSYEDKYKKILIPKKCKKKI